MKQEKVKQIYAVVREAIEDYAGEEVLISKTDGIEYAEEIYNLFAPKTPSTQQEQKHTPSCQNWDGYIDRDGYGRVQVGPKWKGAHRVAWEKVNGEIPKGLVIDHVCRNRACVNILHMEVVTSKENTLRGVNPPAQNARKKKCIKGHELISGNLRKTKDGGRECAICSRERWRAYRLRKKKSGIWSDNRGRKKALAKAGVK